MIVVQYPFFLLFRNVGGRHGQLPSPTEATTVRPAILYDVFKGFESRENPEIIRILLRLFRSRPRI